MKFEVTEHLQYFAGYLDAITRLHTDKEILFSSTVTNITSDSSLEQILNAKIIKEQRIDNMVSFEKEVSLLFGASSKERIMFYLTEYFLWFREFTSSCDCKKYYLKGEQIPEVYLVYNLYINKQFNVLVYICKSTKA